METRWELDTPFRNTLRYDGNRRSFRLLALWFVVVVPGTSIFELAPPVEVLMIAFLLYASIWQGTLLPLLLHTALDRQRF